MTAMIMMLAMVWTKGFAFSLVVAKTLTSEERLRAMMQGSKKIEFNFWLLGMMAGAVVFLLIAIGWRNRVKSEQLADSATGEFRRLAAVLKLSKRECVMLSRIARVSHLPTPITLLLSPGTLKHHADSYGQTLSSAKHSEVDRLVKRISIAAFA